MPGIIDSIALIVSSIATTVTAANALYLGTTVALYAGLAATSVLLQGLLVDKPKVPKPDDGSYNLKQNVPSLAYVLGTTKKGGDYVFLEETGGAATHIIVWAGHKIGGFVQHYLHDEKATFGGDGVITSPSHFDGNVALQFRLGENVETAYEPVVGAFPTIWNDNCRGDGLASVRMRVRTVKSEDHLDVFPNQMPEHSAVGDGALLYDPRKDSTQGGSGSHRYNNPNTWEFTRNIALMRLWHLCHPVGGKMKYENMYLPDWINAANVADENVLNRDGETEKRYHGGFWFRASNDPIEVGRSIDEAGELVVFERADGKVGVHAGEYVDPDITLDARAIYSIRVDKNKRRANTVLGVRGRYVNTANDYNTEDAAIYGDPYGAIDDSTERTKTFENPLIQSHNHCQRKQKLTFIRANARKVSIVADYTADDVRNVPYRRFIRVHYPTRGLTNAVVEITSSVNIDLRNMRISFSGIIVSSTLYDFDAETEEGVPGEAVEPLPDEGVPTPENFEAVVQAEVVSGGALAAYILATWDFYADTLMYELEYDRVTGSTGAQSAYSVPGDTQVRTNYLVDGVEYKVRLRAWGGGTKSDWTDYVFLTVTTDTVAPNALVSFTQTHTSAHLGNAPLSFVTGSDTHLQRIAIYRVPTGNVLNKSTHLVTTIGAAPGTTFGYIDGDSTRTTILTNGDFVADTDWTKGTGWSIAAGKATHTPGTASAIQQAVSLSAGTTYRYSLDVTRSAGNVTPQLLGGSTVSGSSITSSGTFRGTLVAVSGNTDFAVAAGSAFTSDIDNLNLFAETVACAPQGIWDYYAIPLNSSGIEGPQSGPVTITVI